MPAFQGLVNKVLALNRKIKSHRHTGLESFRMNEEIISIPVSFETGEIGAYKIYFPYSVQVMKIRGRVTLLIETTNNGTITGANLDGDSAAGEITATANDAFGTEYSVIPTSNINIPEGSFYQLTTAKSTAGGKVQITLEVKRL